MKLNFYYMHWRIAWMHSTSAYGLLFSQKIDRNNKGVFLDLLMDWWMLPRFWWKHLFQGELNKIKTFKSLIMKNLSLSCRHEINEQLKMWWFQVLLKCRASLIFMFSKEEWICKSILYRNLVTSSKFCIFERYIHLEMCTS